MPSAKHALVLEIPVVLERAARSSLQEQLREQLQHAILDGRLPPGTRLPSTRSLAQELGVSRTVTSAAYDELYAEGYLEAREGSGTFVGSDLPSLPMPRPLILTDTPRWLAKAPPAEEEESLASHVIAFRLGRPSITSLPPRIWRETWKAVTSGFPPSGYGPPNGEPALREAIAHYLGHSRGLACRPDDILITAGATHALDLVARATLSVGDAVGFEEPGYPAARHALLGRGGRLMPIPVDGDGIEVERLPHGSAAPLLVYTTPSHQYPLGTRLSVSRRLALLAWAQTNDSLIVEDDYDSEFRFDAAPLPSLASLDGAERVAYLGTFSEVLTPSLRIGYLVAPPQLRRRVERLQYLTADYPSWPIQKMLAALISGGHLDRHIRRMRKQYALKRNILAQTLAPIAPLAQMTGLEAGLHTYLELQPHLNAVYIAERALERGVLVAPLDGYFLGAPDRAGLLLGYGDLEVSDLVRGASALATVIADAALTIE